MSNHHYFLAAYDLHSVKNRLQEDRLFLQTDFGGAKTLADLLRKIPERNRTQAVMHFLRLKYSEYDLDQPFLDQYRRNQDKLIAILNRMAEENK